jgi:REP element-mobilizing transposase RayT
MGRSLRMKMSGEAGYYHVISRTVGKEFLLGDTEKEVFVELLRHYAGIYFVKVIGFTVMSNHFHLLMKMEPHEDYSDDEVWARVKKFSGNRLLQECRREGMIAKYRPYLENLSEFMRALKQTFSQWYNKNRNREGYFWGNRFKSVVIESGESLLNCLGYIELNPIRAGIVQIPEEYRWCSLSMRMFASESNQFLSEDGLEVEGMPKKEQIRYLRQFIYECGNMQVEKSDVFDEVISKKTARISDEILEKEETKGFSVKTNEYVRGRVRYFTDGVALGSQSFIQSIYHRFGGTVIGKKDRKAHKTTLGDHLLSIRKLRI